MRYLRLVSLLLVFALLPYAGESEASAEKNQATLTTQTGVSGSNCPKNAKSIGLSYLTDEEQALGRRLAGEIERQVKAGFSGSVLAAKGSRILIDEVYATLKGQSRKPGVRFLLPSAAKQFTCAAVSRLQDQGKSRIDEPIGDIFPSVVSDNHSATAFAHFGAGSGL
jgi:CubicO group peptidase (beta-lactamase class C family)